MGIVRDKELEARARLVACLDCIRDDPPIRTVIWSGVSSQPNMHNCEFIDNETLGLFIGFYNMSGKLYKYTYSLEFEIGAVSLTPTANLLEEKVRKWVRRVFEPEATDDIIPFYSNAPREYREYLELYHLVRGAYSTVEEEFIKVRTTANRVGEPPKISRLRIRIKTK